MVYAACFNCDSGKPMVMELKPSMFNEIIDYKNENGTVTDCNFKIIRSGSGQSTRYKTQPRQPKKMDEFMKKAKKKMVGKAAEVAQIILEQEDPFED